jgi:hypothetical protein
MPAHAAKKEEKEMLTQTSASDAEASSHAQSS